MKSILSYVAVAHPRHIEQARFVMEIARRHGAHVRFVASSRPVEAAVVGCGVSTVLEAISRDAAITRITQLRKVLTEVAGGVAWDLVIEDLGLGDAIIQHAPLSDLIVIGEIERRTLEDHVRSDLAERLVMNSSCPVLILPDEGAYGAAARIAVAWKNEPQAGRAVRDAMPLLRAAGTVTVVAIVSPDVRGESTEEAAVVAHLARNGVTASCRRAYASDAGPAILAQAREVGADLLVMGAYGRSRMLELLMGGVTRYVMRHLSMPVLLAH